jgi:hypothetical protein
MTYRQRRISEIYTQIKEVVIRAGFKSEIDWQNNIQLSLISEHDFLREAAWVILSSGMRETIIRRKFPAISAAFYYWLDTKKITQNAKQCRICALLVFGHRQKVNAIITIAEQIYSQGFENFKIRINTDGVEFIQSLPFMGPATSYHLAKNIGLDVVKPDRHLLRVAAAAGYDSPKLLCEEISKCVGDRISVVDLVIWRFATLEPHYTKCFV